MGFTPPVGRYVKPDGVRGVELTCAGCGSLMCDLWNSPAGGVELFCAGCGTLMCEVWKSHGGGVEVIFDQKVDAHFKAKGSVFETKRASTKGGHTCFKEIIKFRKPKSGQPTG